jgi:NAD(P)-dependent dehydrogenase (short-subunit alcohol dehydrogenase family)
MSQVATIDPAKLFNLGERSALVTGATGALGTAAARGLAAAGAKLTLAGGSADKLEQLSAELRAAGASVELVARRPDSLEDAEAMVAAATAAHSAPELIVTAAGVNKVAMIEDQSVTDWEDVMDANVRGSWLVCKAAAPGLIAAGGGKVVLVSSTRGRLGHPAGYSAYCSSKSAVDGLCRTLACEWGKHGINVNAIGPTVFRSDLTAWMYADSEPGKGVREGMLTRIPLGRLGEPEDFVGTLLFLLAPASDFCTGQVLYVDGGYTAG